MRFARSAFQRCLIGLHFQLLDPFLACREEHCVSPKQLKQNMQLRLIAYIYLAAAACCGVIDNTILSG